MLITLSHLGLPVLLIPKKEQFVSERVTPYKYVQSNKLTWCRAHITICVIYSPPASSLESSGDTLRV